MTRAWRKQICSAHSDRSKTRQQSSDACGCVAWSPTHLELGVEQAMGKAAVAREEQEAGRVGVQPADRVQVLPGGGQHVGEAWPAPLVLHGRVHANLRQAGGSGEA